MEGEVFHYSPIEAQQRGCIRVRRFAMKATGEAVDATYLLNVLDEEGCPVPILVEACLFQLLDPCTGGYVLETVHTQPAFSDWFGRHSPGHSVGPSVHKAEYRFIHCDLYPFWRVYLTLGIEIVRVRTPLPPLLFPVLISSCLSTY